MFKLYLKVLFITSIYIRILFFLTGRMCGRYYTYVLYYLIKIVMHEYYYSIPIKVIVS